ncbi:MAG: helix-turn-helix transcriptional regulator [Bauldia sp.]|nr:helix-turn-helix transcriptional regulator [Bauldia sp.]
MAARRPRADLFASAGLVALVIHALRDIDPSLLPPDVSSPDPMKQATTSAAAKRDLLATAYDRGGAGPLLRVGQYLGAVRATPVVHVLATASEPGVFAEKWMRLERYHHATNRTEVKVDGAALVCARSGRDASPTPAENALIAGLIFGFCGLAGGERLVLDIDGRDHDAASLGSVARLRDGGGAFRIRWERWRGTSPDLKATDDDRDIRQSLSSLFQTDPGRGWRVTDAAPILAKSVRGMQRELAQAGTSFSSILRGARLDEAARLLRDATAPLAEIGYCCGYADQPHFQRDFRRVLNMTPREYRQVSVG